MNYENSNKETEILSADEQKLRSLCCSLEKVEAPKDFDFKLKARIADSKASDFQPRFAFVFRYALPALGLILVLGVLAYTGGFLSSGNTQIVASGSTGTNPALPQNSAASNSAAPEKTEKPIESVAVLPSNQALPKTPENEIAGSNPKGKEINKKPGFKNDDFKGNKLESVKPAPELYPRGINPKVSPQNPQNDENIVPMKVKEILSQIGIDADFENGRWTVKSVTVNGIAEASGVKEKDVIEAIDDKPLSTETINVKTFSGKTVTVTRGGVKSQINLRSKQ